MIIAPREDASRETWRGPGAAGGCTNFVNGDRYYLPMQLRSTYRGQYHYSLSPGFTLIFTYAADTTQSLERVS